MNARPRTTNALLTREPNAEIDAIHPKAMPVILTAPEEVETWMTAPLDEALKPQRRLPDGSLRIVARGVVGGGSGATIRDGTGIESIQTGYWRSMGHYR